MAQTHHYLSDEDKRAHLTYLVAYLLQERDLAQRVPEDQQPDKLTTEGLWTMFRALVNTREAGAADSEFVRAQDRLLQSMIAENGVSGLSDTTRVPLDGRMRLWRGDITTLFVDGIVNAANSELLGCWQPGHYCIDNAIHTFAGIQLRAECAKLMLEQGRLEPTGQAKVTSAWNLPATYVVHTVGPIVKNGQPTSEQRSQLASCYASCLDAALEHGMKSLGFCCISTGVFGFPQKEAAEIAVRSVREWLLGHPEADIVVVFNVFGDEDELIYKRLFGI